MSLAFVEPSQAMATVNVLLYGGPGTGKTVGACSVPGPVLVVNADQPNAMSYAHARYGDHVREVRVDGAATLDEVYLALRDGGEFRSVVVDPVGELHRLLIEEASGKAIRPKIQQYGDVAVRLERFCRALCELPVNVVLVAHETAIKDEESGHFERLPWTGTTNPALGAKLAAMVDIVAYCGVVEPEGQENAGPRYVAQLITANGRRGKDRTGVLGKARDLDLAEWLAATGRGGSNGAKATTKGSE